jgi:Cd2+/Zn2+-exporting ATPase
MEDVKVGDLVVVELGEKVPVDGIAEKGEAMVDQSSLTGESIPVFKKQGDKILSFTTVVSGNITIRVEKVGQETTFEKILKLVEKSQSNKARIQTLGDSFSKWYIIVTIIAAAIIYFYTRNTTLVLSLLLVSCADDVAIAIPLALTTALVHTARHGVIVKGGNFIEGFSKIKVMIFDKTGTLTSGKLKVEKVFAFGRNSEEEVISLAGTASLLSHHPVSQTIAEFAKSKNAYTPEPADSQELMGKGIIATINNEKIISGKIDFFKELGIEINKEEMYIIDQEMEKGFNITLIGKNNQAMGFLALSDTIRPNLKNIIAEIKKMGIKKIVMLTGDNEKIAEKISKEAGIDEYYANLLPEQKTEHFERYMDKDYKVAMVGDGVNDAPCIAMADIGIAMGAIGSDAAIESADIAIMRDDLSQIPELMKISKKTLSVIKQDLAIWIAINILGFVLVFNGYLDPVGAAAFNFVTDFIPIINSLRLFR